MGLDWATLSLSGYFESLEAHNEMHDPEAARGEPKPVSERFRRFMKAHEGNSDARG